MAVSAQTRTLIRLLQTNQPTINGDLTTLVPHLVRDILWVFPLRMFDLITRVSVRHPKHVTIRAVVGKKMKFEFHSGDLRIRGGYSRASIGVFEGTARLLVFAPHYRMFFRHLVGDKGGYDLCLASRDSSSAAGSSLFGSRIFEPRLLTEILKFIE